MILQYNLTSYPFFNFSIDETKPKSTIYSWLLQLDAFLKGSYNRNGEYSPLEQRLFHILVVDIYTKRHPLFDKKMGKHSLPIFYRNAEAIMLEVYACILHKE